MIWMILAAAILATTSPAATLSWEPFAPQTGTVFSATVTRGQVGNFNARLQSGSQTRTNGSPGLLVSGMWYDLMLSYDIDTGRTDFTAVNQTLMTVTSPTTGLQWLVLTFTGNAGHRIDLSELTLGSDRILPITFSSNAANYSERYAVVMPGLRTDVQLTGQFRFTYTGGSGERPRMVIAGAVPEPATYALLGAGLLGLALLRRRRQ